jgi:Concanavalin A-like lectin/glucanases superfamily
VVLSRARAALVIAAGLAGCGQSLFDAHGDGDRRRDAGTGGDDDGSIPVPDTCPAGTCVADVAADYNGMPGGSNGRWRYLDDERNRKWTAMKPDMMNGMVGADPRNTVKPCTASSVACQKLSSAVLVTSSGTTGAADPAIEFRTFLPRAFQLAIRVHIEGAEQRVRIYRNSREDVLFTAIGAPGDDVEKTLLVDAIANDRFLVALEPTTAAEGIAAVRFFVIDAEQRFPQTCMLAVPFTSTSGNYARDLCDGNDMLFMNGPMPGPPIPTDDAFGTADSAAFFETDLYYRGTRPLARSSVFTLQLWLRHELFQPSTPDSWVISDLDEANGGGLGLFLRPGTPVQLHAAYLTGTGPAVYMSHGVEYKNLIDWHFIRVIHDNDKLTLCLDGTRADTFTSVPAPRLPGEPLTVGRNGKWDPLPQFVGAADDVRVFSSALPCNEP